MVYSIWREEAAKQLGMSTRTVDRYIRKGKIRSRKVGKLIMLHKDDVNVLVNGGVQQDYEIVTPETKKVSKEASTQMSSSTNGDLFEILNSKMQEKDDLIQELSYKLGKMETELKNSIPKLEHRKATLLLEESQHKRAEDTAQLKETNRVLWTQLSREKNLSTVMIILAFVLFMIMIFVLYKYLEIQSLLWA